MRRLWISLLLASLAVVVVSAVATTDAFTYAASASLESQASGVWLNLSASPNTTGSGIECDDWDAAEYDVAARNFGDDQYAQVVIKGFGTGGYVGVVLRSLGDQWPNENHYSILATATDVHVWLLNNGTLSELNAFAVSWAVNDVLKAGMAGTTIQVFKNGTQVGTNVSDLTIATGQPGLTCVVGVTNASLDDWAADDGYTLVTSGGGGLSSSLGLLGVGR